MKRVKQLALMLLASLLAQGVWAAIPTPVAHWTNLSEGAKGGEEGTDGAKFTLNTGTGCTFSEGKAVTTKTSGDDNTGLLVEWEDGAVNNILTIVVKYSSYSTEDGNNCLLTSNWGANEIVAYANGGASNVGLSANVKSGAGGTQSMSSPAYAMPKAGYIMMTTGTASDYGTALAFKPEGAELFKEIQYQSGYRYSSGLKHIKIGGTVADHTKYYRPTLTIEEITIYTSKVTAADMNAENPTITFTKASSDWDSKTMPTRATTAAVTQNTSFAGNAKYLATIGTESATVVNVTSSTANGIYGLHAIGGNTGLGNTTRDIYLMVSGGTPNVVCGGEDAKHDGTKTVLTGDTLVNVCGNTVVDYVYGAGMGGGNNVTTTGNVGIVIEGEAQVKGTVAGGWQSRHYSQPKVTGNTSVLVKNVQTYDSSASTTDTNNVGCQKGYVIGGSISWGNGGAGEINGNSSVKVDLADTANGEFKKGLVGGNFHINTYDTTMTVKGNSSVEVSAPATVTFSKDIVGGGFSMTNGKTSKVEGNSSVVLNGGTYTASIYAGGNGPANKAPVNGTATLTINGGVFSGAHLNAGTATGAKKLVFNCSREFAWANITGFNEIAIADAQQFTMSVANSNVRELSAALTGAGSFVKTGTGTLTLSGTNTYTGNTTISGGTVKATTKNSLGTGTVTAQSGTTLFVPATDETPYTIGGGAVKVRVSAEQQAGDFPLVTGIKVADGAELTLSVVDASDAELATLEATVENGVIKIDAKVEFKDVLWNRENSRWEDSNGTEVTMDKTCNIALIDGDSVTFTASPNKVVLPASGTVTINNHQNLGSMLINVPESTTLILPTSGYSENIKFSGTGTIQIGGTNTATKHNLYNNWLRNANLEDFTGTLHLVAGRFETQTEAVKSDVTIKVTNGAQLSTGSTGTWNNHFILSGNGWTGESGAFNTVPLRLGCTLGESAIVDMVREETDTVEPGISVHSQDLTIGATITGTCGMRLIGGTAQTLTFSKPQNCTLTGTVTVNNLNLRFSKTDGTAIGMSAGQAIHFGDTIKLSAGKYLKLHPWTGSACDNSTSNKVTIECSIELADGSYITVDDGSYVFSGNVSVVENATAKFTPNWRKGWIFSNLNVPASATFTVEQDQHNDANSSTLYITGGSVAGTLNVKGTQSDRPVITTVTSSVITSAKAINLKGCASLDLGDARSLSTHIVAAEGVNTLKVVSDASTAVVSNGDTAANPFIKIAEGATLTLNYNNFSGWNGAVTDGWIVNEGTLKIQSQGGSGFFRNHLVLTDGHNVSMENTSGSAMLIYGGASSADAAQIQLASGSAEISGIENAKGICIGNSFNDGDYGLENGSKAVGVNVGDSATLTISALVTKGSTDAHTGTLTKWGDGALVLSNESNTFDGAVTLKAGTIQSSTTLNVTTDVVGMEVVGDGSEATPYALQLKTFTVTAPTGDGLTVSAESVTGNYGDTVTITYTLAENYILKSGDLSQQFTYSESAQEATLPTVVLAAAKIGETLYETMDDAIAHIADGEIVHISGDVPADYKIVDGKVVAKVYVAQVGANKYETLDEAMTAAGEDGTVTLLDTTLAAPTGYAKVTTEGVVTLRKPGEIGWKTYGSDEHWTSSTAFKYGEGETSMIEGDTVVVSSDLTIYIQTTPVAKNIKVANNATLRIGCESGTNLSDGWTITAESGTTVKFIYWGHGDTNTGKIGNVTFNGEGSFEFTNENKTMNAGTIAGNATISIVAGGVVNATSVAETISIVTPNEAYKVVPSPTETGVKYEAVIKTYTVNLKTFENTTCLVKVNDGEEFTFTETFTVNHGDKVVFHYVANEGYEITAGSDNFQYRSVTVDVTPTTGTINVTVAKLTYTITITPVEHTTVTVDGEAYTESTKTVEYGSNVTIKYTADENYKLSGEGSFTCTEVKADTTVGEGLSAVLDVTTITIPTVANMTAAVVDGNGQAITISESNTITVTIGSTFTVTYTPNEGYVGEPITLETITAAADTTVTAPTEGLPVAANSVAKIGNTGYETLGAAVEVGGVIELLQDVTENVTIPEGKTVTLTGAHTITPANTAWYTIDVQGNLTIDGVTVQGVTGITKNGPSCIRVGYDDDATANQHAPAKLTVVSGSVKDGLNAIKGDSGADIVISGGEISKDNKVSNTAIILNYGKLAITGGTLTGVAATVDGVLNAGNGTATITGGTIYGRLLSEVVKSSIPEGVYLNYAMGGINTISNTPAEYKTLAGTVDGAPVYIYCVDVDALVAKTTTYSVDGVCMTKNQAFVKGNTVKLMTDNVIMSSTISLEGMTIDLNGKTLAIKQNDKVTDTYLTIGKSMTIKNGTLTATDVRINLDTVELTVIDATIPAVKTTKVGYEVVKNGNVYSIAKPVVDVPVVENAEKYEVSVNGGDTTEHVAAPSLSIDTDSTLLYTIKAKNADGEVVETTKIGVIAAKAAETGSKPKAVTTAVAVPFTGATVANLLNTTLLKNGDTLQAYITVDGTSGYAKWNLIDGKWVGENITLGIPAQPNTTKLARGTAVWVTSAGKVVALGKYNEEDEIVVPTTAETHLLANPTMSDYTPAVEATDPEDQVVEIGVENPVRYTKVNGKWMKPGLIEEDDGEVVKGPVAGAPVIPVGKGFWFIKK